ncbi:ABC transporter ATP-binding protein [Bradyrhizobium sp. CCGUVB1N3]|uniref:ABC transporter ATP-binding protein n=1 Tax=Bradyrhizobium sp. CCGUVB1N3 TaxID=2949629 RepID=UPI0020B41214|nr:ABC transporter ATP-binding protein [Bradyrhizobium sp. CCGUVB1N3]MCP3476496.1 ABC transporter ATP-binding protein [Bradyrhizobium sp. CCGUVB1N3]
MSGADVCLRSVSKSFAGRTVLHKVDLDITAGQFVSVIGPSGAGKSTLLRLLAGLETPSGGRIELRAIGHKADVRLMFQEDRLLPWRTVLGNVLLGLKGRDREAERILGAVGLRGREGEFPVGLSGGQRQRVALARALIHEPDLLLLDEPFGALDAITRVAMQLLLEQLLAARPRTVVLVTHDVEEALLLSDRVLLVKDGGIARDLGFDRPRPRHRGDPTLATLKEELLDGLLTAEGNLSAVA